MLLPFQGDFFIITNRPRALPWARCFWVFSPTLDYLRKFRAYSFLLLLSKNFLPAAKNRMTAAAFSIATIQKAPL